MDNTKLEEYFRKLDRSKFIDNEYASCSGIDAALPIGFEQTISQPSLVLKMTQILQVDENCKVLEIGTGSGYQTALLSKFAKEVFTMEFIPELSNLAKERLDKMGYINIKYMVGDGTNGWQKYAPFDRIMVTAAASKIPQELIKQLANDGRMVIPIGPRGDQNLLLVKKDNDGNVEITNIEKVTFVELRGSCGWESD